MATLKFSIADEAKAFVREQALAKNTSEADVIRRALEAYRFLEEVRAHDGAVVLKRSDGELERLVRF